MKYTVTIKDNETGKIVREVECNSIVGGVSFNDTESASIGISSCNGKELLGACQSARKAISKIIKDSPALRLFYSLYEMELISEMMSEKEEKEDTDND